MKGSVHSNTRSLRLLVAAAAVALASGAGCTNREPTYWNVGRVGEAETALDALLVAVATALDATIEHRPTYRVTTCGDNLRGSASVAGTATLSVSGGWAPTTTAPLYLAIKELGLPVVRPYDDGFDASSDELNLQGSFRNGNLILGLGTSCHP